MTTQQKIKNYRQSMLFLSAGYVIGVMAAAVAGHSKTLSPLTIYIAAIIPTLFIFAILWVQWKFVKSLDEYLRAIHTEAMIIGSMISIAVAGSWGLPEMLADVPHLPVFYVMPLYYLAFAVSITVLKKRAKITGCI